MIKKVIANSAIYIGFDVLNKAIPFLLLPIMTKYLSPEEYGSLASFQAMVVLFMIMISLETHSSIGINYYRLSKEQLNHYIMGVIAITVFISVLLLLSIVVSNAFNLLPILFNVNYYLLAVIISLLSLLGQINLILYRFSENPIAFGMVNFLSVIGGTIVSLYLVISMHYGWEGRAFGMLIGVLILAFFFFRLLVQDKIISQKINFEYIKDSLKIGIPIIPHALAGFARSGADRFILVGLVGISSVGIYGVSFQIASVIMILASGINMAWTPYFYKQLALSSINKEQLVKYSYVIIFGFILFAVLYLFVIDFIFYHFINKAYSEGKMLAILISFGFSLEIVYYIFVNYLFYMKKTIYISYSTFLSAVAYFGFLYMLTPIYGLIGIGIAFILSYLISTVLIIIFSIKIFPMPWLSFWRKHEI